MRFIIDAQLPPGLAERLRSSGHNADHVHDLGLGDASDAMIWRHVCRRRAVLVTKDQDFVVGAEDAPDGTAVIWIRLGNTSNRALWSAFEPLLPEIVEALGKGEKLIEISE